MPKNFRPGPAWVVGKIKKQLGLLSYLVRVQGDFVWKHHVDHLKALGENALTAPAESDSSESANFGNPETPATVQPAGTTSSPSSPTIRGQ